jgi:hypothetical protein
VKATSIPQAAREMLSRNGLLGWIAAQTPLDANERKLMINVIENIVDALLVSDNDKIATVVEALDTLRGVCNATEG